MHGLFSKDMFSTAFLVLLAQSRILSNLEEAHHFFVKHVHQLLKGTHDMYESCGSGDIH